MKCREIPYVTRDNQNNLLSYFVMHILSLDSKHCEVLCGVSTEHGYCDLVTLFSVLGFVSPQGGTLTLQFRTWDLELARLKSGLALLHTAVQAWSLI